MSNPAEILRKFCDGTELGPFEIDQLKAAGFIARNPTDHSWFVTVTGHVALHQVPVPVELGATVERFKLGGALTGEEVKALRTWKLAEDSLYGARVTPLGESVHRQWAAARDAANHHPQLPPGDSASCPDDDSYHPPPNKTLRQAAMEAQDELNRISRGVLDVQIGGDHYKAMGNHQPWEVLATWMTPEELRGYMKGTVITYLAREQQKGGDLDIKKAMHTMELWQQVRKDK